MSHVLCVYHREDFDGVCSAAIVEAHTRMAGYELIAIGADYGDNPDLAWTDIMAKIQGLDIARVFVVDFCYEDDKVMARLAALGQQPMVYIDHHDSGIRRVEALKNMGLDAGQGLDVEIVKSAETISACELAWTWLFPNREIPDAVDLLSCYDTWRLDNCQVLPFQYGLKSRSTAMDFHAEIWPWLLNLSGSYRQNLDLIEDITELGRAVVDYITATNTKQAKSVAFTAWIDGWCFCCGNAVMANTDTFKTAFKKQHQAAMVFYVLDDGRWKFTVSRIHNSEFNAGEFAEAMAKTQAGCKGGGRAEVAGFILNTMPDFITKR